MKNLLYVLILVLIGGSIFWYVNHQKETKAAAQIEQDYAKIEEVKKAGEKLAKTSKVKAFGNQAAWYIFDVRAAYQKEDAFNKALQAELGADFDNQLSNGDYIFLGVYPANQKIKVFAGDPANPENMVYPEWKYTKLPER